MPLLYTPWLSVYRRCCAEVVAALPLKWIGSGGGDAECSGGSTVMLGQVLGRTETDGLEAREQFEELACRCAPPVVVSKDDRRNPWVRWVSLLWV